MSLRNLVAGLLLCPVLDTLFAATPSHVGRVRDNSGNPLEFANVTLQSLNDSTLIDGTVTDSAGAFAVTGNGMPAFLRVSAMGFEVRIIDNPRHDTGDIILVPASYMLGEVTAEGSHPKVRLNADGVRVEVAGTTLAHTGTVLELLGKIPFVTTQGSEIEVLGKGAPLVFINGRQVRDPSELTRLASSRIKSVDVVTDPGAGYASTANSVIRITTAVPAGEGFSAGNRATAGYKHYAYLFEQFDLNWRKKGLDIFGILNYENYRERETTNTTAVRYLKAGTVRHNSSAHDRARYPVCHGKVGMNHNMASHSLGFFYDFSYMPSESAGSSSTDRYIDNLFSESLENTSESSRHERRHMLSAYYTGEAGKWKLSANFDALWQNNNRHNAENEMSSLNAARHFTTINDTHNRLLAVNATASLPVWKGKLRFGTEVSDIRRTDIYTGNAAYITDSDIRIHETTSALFAETEQPFGPVTASMGVRWEYTDSRFWQSEQFSADKSREYHNIAPSAALAFTAGDVQTRLVYTRKTSRPAFA